MKSFFSFVFLFISVVIFDQCEADSTSYCENTSACQSIHPSDYKKGIFSKCEPYMKGTKSSKNICAIIFITNPQFKYDAKAVNPNPALGCTKDASMDGKEICENYRMSYSPYDVPYNGTVAQNCYTKAKPYLCPNSGKQILTCSVQGSNCR